MEGRDSAGAVVYAATPFTLTQRVFLSAEVSARGMRFEDDC